MTEERFEFRISFEGTPAERGAAARELQSLIASRAGTPPESAAVIREDESTQDAGQILQLVLNSGALLTIAHGIRTYLQKRPDGITVRTPTGEVVITGEAVRGQDAAAVARALTTRVSRK